MTRSWRLLLTVALVGAMGFLLAACTSPVGVDPPGNDAAGDESTGDDTAAPSPVGDLAATAEDGRVTLTWTDPTDADINTVQVRWSPGDADALEIDDGVQSVTVDGLVNGTEYTFSLTVLDVSGNRSTESTVTATPSDTTPPAAPTNLSATPGDAQVALAWTDPADADFTEIVITWSSGDVEVATGAEAVTIDDLTNGTEYTFSLEAMDASGNRSSTVTISATPETPDADAPAAVSAVTSTAGDTVVTLDWTDPSDSDLANIEITWSPDGSAVQEVDPGEETFVAVELTNGTEYTFSIVAVDNVGNRSAEVSVSAVPEPPDTDPPSEVADLTTAIDDSVVTLDWNDPSDPDLARIEVTWTPDGSTAQEIDPGVETFPAVGLTNGTEYMFSVQAVDDAGNKSNAVTVSATPLFGPLSAPSFSQPGGDYFVSVDVELSVADGSASIYYTLDGSEPTESSTEYTGGAISLGPGTTTVRARAYKSDSEPSSIAEAVYDVQDGILVTTDSMSGPGSLDEAITNATSGEEIRFDGSYTINAVNAEAGWEIDTPIIINGVGHTVTIRPAIGGGGIVQNDRRAFTVLENSGLTIKNLSFEDANLTNNRGGGAVRVQEGGSLTVDSVTFSENSADGNGGAILLKSGTTAVIENSTFFDNFSGTGGGGIFVDDNSSLTISDTVFDQNGAGYFSFSGNFSGGAIRIIGSSTAFEISDSEFKDNRAMKYGGAIDIATGATGDIVRSEFRRNWGGRYNDSGAFGGGAINVGQNSTLRVAGTLFRKNRAYYTPTQAVKRVGGAIRNQGTLISYGNTFEGNYTEDTGAAIYSGANADELTISSSSFVGNYITVNTSTGAAVLTEAATSTIQLSTFSHNYNGGDNTAGAVNVRDRTNNTSELTYSAFRNGTFDPDDFDTLNDVIADGLAVPDQVTDADPGFTQDADPSQNDWGDLRPDTGSPLHGAGDASILLQDVADADGDGDTTEDEPFDASGTTGRVLGTIEIGAWEVAE